MSDDERVFDDDEKQRAWLAGLARVLANPAQLPTAILHTDGAKRVSAPLAKLKKL